MVETDYLFVPAVMFLLLSPENCLIVASCVWNIYGGLVSTLELFFSPCAPQRKEVWVGALVLLARSLDSLALFLTLLEITLYNVTWSITFFPGDSEGFFFFYLSYIRYLFTTFITVEAESGFYIY